MNNHQLIINHLFIIINLSSRIVNLGGKIDKKNRPVISRYCSIEAFGKSSDDLPSFCRNLPIIVNRPTAIANDAFPQSIDNPSTKPKNLSTGKRPMLPNNQTILRLYDRIFRTGFCPALSESTDNQPTFFRNRQIIVNRSGVIVKWRSLSYRTKTNQRIVGIAQHPMEIA